MAVIKSLVILIAIYSISMCSIVNAEKSSKGNVKKSSDDTKFELNEEYCAARKSGPYCCGYPNEYFRTIDGKEEKVPGYPWVVSLNLKGKPICGGTMINEDHILTSSDCLLDDEKTTIDLKELTIHFPATDVPDDDGLKIKRTFNYKGKDAADNELSVIVMDKPIKFDDERRPICLPVFADGQMKSATEYVHLSSDDCEVSGGNALYTVDLENERYVLSALLKKNGGCARGDMNEHFDLTEDMINWLRKETKDSCYCDTN